MNKPLKIVLIIIAMAFVSAGCDSKLTTTTKNGILTINSVKIPVSIADDDPTREKGLSGQQSLPSDSGMIFIFQKEDKHGFWMKETNFPLDFIWIKDNKVTEITADVPTQLFVTENKLKVYTPKEPIDWMLEVNAGFAAKKGIKVGDSVRLDQ
ncbi:MAG: DUF192 domain-containing protein [Candidatus Doudnabacteria bacterium]|nr:DUF192 domain-containing protein [Candidatus Doudnabacteria bacterium]